MPGSLSILAFFIVPPPASFVRKKRQHQQSIIVRKHALKHATMLTQSHNHFHLRDRDLKGVWGVWSRSSCDCVFFLLNPSVPSIYQHPVLRGAEFN